LNPAPPPIAEKMEVENPTTEKPAEGAAVQQALPSFQAPVPQPEGPMDTFDAFMATLEDLQKTNDAKKKGKEGTEVMWNGDTVYEEEDLLVDDTSIITKSWVAKKKELKPVDHTAQEYEDFRKNFYIESPDIKKMTEEEVKAYKETELKGVKVRGENCPRPVKRWSQLGLPEKVMKTLGKVGYLEPFGVQCVTIPAIMSGRDLIACAKTGSGKTAAFVLPMLRHIKDQRTLDPGEGPIGLICTPTRELAMQIFYETRRFAKPCGLRVAAIYGGAPISEQIAAMKRGAEIVVCTPGRMIDILCTNQGRVTNMHRLTYVVLDEADRMFDLGFEPQVMNILRQSRPNRQTLLFSATFPRVIENLARQILKEPLEIVVGGRSIASEDVIQYAEIIPEKEKFQRLLELVGTHHSRGNILIFHDQREAVDNLFSKLQRCGYMVAVLHGGVDQYDRDNTVSDFKNKVKTIMIATSIASRGLDVKDLKLVINFTAPHHYEDYVHRVGRTGRAGNKGLAYTFVDPKKEAKQAPDIVKAMERSGYGKNVTEEMKKLAIKFKKKVKAGEAQADEKRGYNTKGFKFDEDEARKKKEHKKRQQAVYCDPDEIPDVVISELEKSKIREEEARRKLEVLKEKEAETDDPVKSRIAAIKAAIELAKSKAKHGKAPNKKDIKNAIKRREKQAKRKQKKFRKEKVKALLDSFHHEEMVKQYEKENIFSVRLDINDYPEKVRKRVCWQSTLDQTIDFVGGSVEIKRRGIPVPPGKRPEPGEEKMYLLIQGENRVAVNAAKKELARIVNEAMQNIRGGFVNSGRYTVV